MANPCLEVDVSTFKRRVFIERLMQVSDNQGGYLEEWQRIKTVWASIEPMSQREVYWGMQVASPATHKITMRYIPLLTTKERIVYGHKVFNMTSIRNLEEASAFLEILAFEGA